MAKLRVYQLARELNRDNFEIIRELQHLGVPVTSHSNTVDDRHADELRRKLGAGDASDDGIVAVDSDDAVVAVEEPVVEAAKAVEPPPPASVVAPQVEVRPQPAVETRVEARVEARVEPKVERPPVPTPAPPAAPALRTPPPVARPVVAPPAPMPAAPPPPAPPAAIIQTRPPEAPAKKETSIEEQRKTIQQIVQERLRNRFPQPTVPPLRRPPVPGQRHPTSANTGRTIVLPPRDTGMRTGVRPAGTGAAPAAGTGTDVQRRPTPVPGAERDRTNRYEREAEKRLGPHNRPQPKVEAPREFRRITLTEGLTIKDLAEKLDVKTRDLIRKLIDRGVFATINQPLDKEMAKTIARDFNAEVEFLTFEESVILNVVETSKEENLQPRSPVVTVMGHVDHGKTSLLDAIRKARVTEQEHGGITQHIGAYQIQYNNRKITFLDTPGHEAFTLMRARGAKVTDIVVLVVAADDGIMPQTLESISHTRAAKVPLIVAINKIDKPDANVERVKRQLAENNLLAEDWGGDTVMVEVSAKMGQRIPELLEMILLVADLQNLKADPDLNALGTVLEAKVDRGRGNVATMLVQNGTLRVGDNFLVGAVFGKVRAMLDEHGKSMKEAGPSTPVEVLGLQGLPLAGDTMQVVSDEAKARQMAQFRQEKQRDIQMAKSSRLTLDQLHKQLAEGDVKEVQIILKSDVQGSSEALTDMLNKLSTDKVKVRIIHSSVGAITETDVLLGVASSNAIIVGFNVRPEKKAAELANREKVEIRLHTVIYNVVDEIKRAMLGVLEPVIKETYLGTAEVRNTFRIPKVGLIAGSYITEGKIPRGTAVRLLRDNVVIFEGKISSLKRFKEDASEVSKGYECGIGIQNFNDVKVGDVIEAFMTEKVMAEVG